jgi:hypothetical protein
VHGAASLRPLGPHERYLLKMCFPARTSWTIGPIQSDAAP